MQFTVVVSYSVLVRLSVAVSFKLSFRDSESGYFFIVYELSSMIKQ